MHRLADIALWILKRYASEETQHKILTECVKHHFNLVSADDILRQEPDGTMRFEGKTLDGTYRKELREQAALLDKLLLWRVLKTDVRYNINKKMYDGAAVIQHMISGKVAEWLFEEVIQKRINHLKG